MFGVANPRRFPFSPAAPIASRKLQTSACERALKEKGVKYSVGNSVLASGKALAVGESEGRSLLVGELQEILGAHIIGADATEMIGELGLAITLEYFEELVSTIHAHPTLSEAIHEQRMPSRPHQST
jgi:dihydrolipoamide dehydrogenase